ncbi:uracil-DNA glycosylase [Nocardioides sp. Iso805N]|uniref:uracil-DNA glycosylase n=1 Tax=Nocardioides sp. Iso805N TaxID=1283287 RepID=UPI00036E20A2|nr:uracil-DNA glycosylase [Nocardioides sp. Iso805N]
MPRASSPPRHPEVEIDGLLPHPATGRLFPSPVPPGTGWPGDPATAETPIARTAAQVRRLAGRDRLDTRLSLDELGARVSVCRACPRLVEWREEVAETKRASYAGEPYWGRPIPGFGSTTPSILIVGLAPAANGANRTGRVFTGDRSGDWLFASLHRVGLATQGTSVHAADGLELIDTRMVATVRCAPPQNKPTTRERDTCSPWIEAELRLLAEHVTVVVALGAIGWDATLRSYAALGWQVARPKPRFGHGVEATLVGEGRSVTLLGCYHPSQQNTFTGRLTEAMLDGVLARAAGLRETATD